MVQTYGGHTIESMVYTLHHGTQTERQWITALNGKQKKNKYNYKLLHLPDMLHALNKTNL